MEFTDNNREIIESVAESPVTRVRIKKHEITLRYSNTCTQERMDEIYDIMLRLEEDVPLYSPTIRVKILDTDDLNTIQFEIGPTGKQTKILKQHGIDY